MIGFFIFSVNSLANSLVYTCFNFASLEACLIGFERCLFFDNVV